MVALSPSSLVLITSALLVAVVLSPGILTATLSVGFSAALLLCYQPARLLSCIGRSLSFALPLFFFLLIVWVVIVGDTRGVLYADTGAAEFVEAVSARLFALIFVLQASHAIGGGVGALEFVGALRLAPSIKNIIVMAYSLMYSFREAIQRSWFAFVAANIVSGRPRLFNVMSSHLLLRSVWLSVLSILADRIETKWAVEDTGELLGRFFGSFDQQYIEAREVAWFGGALTILVHSALQRLVV